MSWGFDRLEAFARALAEAPDRWRHLVSHDPAQRTYELLHHDETVMAWLICWMDDHDTGFHDHDGSAGAVAVVEGAVREERLRLGAEPARRIVRGGESFTLPRPTSTACCTTAPLPRSRCTRTRRRCGAWAPTRSSPAARCAGTRFPTPRNCAPWRPSGNRVAGHTARRSLDAPNPRRRRC